jgi:hypothetical protein
VARLASGRSDEPRLTWSARFGTDEPAHRPLADNQLAVRGLRAFLRTFFASDLDLDALRRFHRPVWTWMTIIPAAREASSARLVRSTAGAARSADPGIAFDQYPSGWTLKFW